MKNSAGRGKLAEGLDFQIWYCQSTYHDTLKCTLTFSSCTLTSVNFLCESANLCIRLKDLITEESSFE